MGFLTEDLSFEFGTTEIRIIKNGRVAIECPIERDINASEIKYTFNGKELKGVGLPLKAGVIGDFDLFEKLLRGAIRSIPNKKKGFLNPALKSLIVIPDDITEVEIRAFRDSLEHSGSKEVLMSYSTYCTAIGFGLLNSNESAMIIDFGGGKIGLSIWHNNQPQNCSKIGFGAIKLKEIIHNKIKDLYDIRMTNELTEDIFHNYLNVSKRQKNKTTTIYGKTSSGTEKNSQLEIEQIYNAIEPYLKVLDNEINMTINNFSQSFNTKINSIYITGGLSKLSGLYERLEEITGLTIINKSDINYTLEGLKILDSDKKSFLMR